MAENDAAVPPTTLQRLQAFAEQDVGESGSITLQWDGDRQEWAFAAVWGEEAPGSPMAGAATYGMDADVMTCIEQALTDARRGPGTELKSGV